MFSLFSGKKGQIAISFNWIFVIIVGAIFLGFFFTMISSSSKTNEKKVAGQLAKSFENQLSVASNEPGLVKIIDDTTRLDIEMTCKTRQGIYDLVVNGVRIRDTKYDLLFYLVVRANQLGLKTKEIPVERNYPKGKIPTKITGLKVVDLVLTAFKATLGFYHP